MNRNEYVWYASYGSNLLEERFHCYIRGGRPIGSNKNYIGCEDKSLPIDIEEILINHELYFAKKSASWDDGGVCFIKINPDKNIKTLGKMYLITKKQFADVLKQEISNQKNIEIDFSQTILKGSLVCKEKSWYGNIIYLGNKRDYPIFTFTNSEDLECTNKPSKNYLKTIIIGINETYDLTREEVIDYLSSKKGIEKNYSYKELIEIIESI